MCCPGWCVSLPVSPDIRLEVDIAAGKREDSQLTGRSANPAAVTCPNCRGVMFVVRGARPPPFRCQVGHAMTAGFTAKQQDGALDEVPRVALRVIKERAEPVARMAEHARNAARRSVAEMYEHRPVNYRQHADMLRQAVLMSMAAAARRAIRAGREKHSEGQVPPGRDLRPQV
jgi:two-component system chemotaxis response regulator CheB